MYYVPTYRLLVSTLRGIYEKRCPLETYTYLRYMLEKNSAVWLFINYIDATLGEKNFLFNPPPRLPASVTLAHVWYYVGRTRLGENLQKMARSSRASIVDIRECTGKEIELSRT